MSEKVVGIAADVSIAGKKITPLQDVIIEQKERDLFVDVKITGGGNVEGSPLQSASINVGINYGGFGEYLKSSFTASIKKSTQRITGDIATTTYLGRLGSDVSTKEGYLNVTPPSSVYFIPQSFTSEIKKILNIKGMATNWDNMEVRDGYLIFKFSSPAYPDIFEVPIDIGYSFGNSGIVKRADNVSDIIAYIEDISGINISFDIDFPLQFIETWEEGESLYEIIKKLFNPFKPFIFFEDNTLIISKAKPRGSITIPSDIIFSISGNSSTEYLSNLKIIGKPEIRKQIKFNLPPLDTIKRDKDISTENFSFSRRIGNSEYNYTYILNNTDGTSYPTKEEVFNYDGNGELISKVEKTYEYNSEFEPIKETSSEYNVVEGELKKIKEKIKTREKDPISNSWLFSTITEGYVVAHHIEGEDVYKIELTQALRTHSYDTANNSFDVLRWEKIEEETETIQQISDKFALKTTARTEFLTNTTSFQDSIIPIVKTNVEKEATKLSISLNRVRKIYRYEGTDKNSPPAVVDFIHCDDVLAEKIKDAYFNFENMQSNKITIKTIFLPEVKVGMGININNVKTDLSEVSENQIKQIELKKLEAQNLMITGYRHTINQNGAFTELIIRAY